MKYLYLVLSKTSTLTGRIIRFYTKETVNHSAISLTEDLTQMYTFARKRACNCIDGGLVLESPNTLDVYKRQMLFFIEEKSFCAANASDEVIFSSALIAVSYTHLFSVRTEMIWSPTRFV